MSDVFDEAPANSLDLNVLQHGSGGCVSMICWYWIGEENANEKQWEVLMTM